MKGLFSDSGKKFVKPMFDGILLLDKKPGETSTSCVERTWRALGKKCKVGHGGTLDSPASGLLLLLIGAATRSCAFAQALNKKYEVEAQLGAFSDTDDATGVISAQSAWEGVTPGKIQESLLGFLGLRNQVPPSISAVHVSGRRAHEIARSGYNPSISPRPVKIDSFSKVEGPDSSGMIRFGITCHKGTYVRSLVRDLGRRLGCGAYVRSLRRLSIGMFDLNQASPLDTLLSEGPLSFEKAILPLDSLLDHFLTYRVPEELEADLRNGKPIPFDRLARLHWGFIPESGHVALRTPRLVSFALPEAPGQGVLSFRPDVVLAVEERT